MDTAVYRQKQLVLSPRVMDPSLITPEAVSINSELMFAKVPAPFPYKCVSRPS